jgi:hypothetical protein
MSYYGRGTLVDAEKKQETFSKVSTWSVVMIAVLVAAFVDALALGRRRARGRSR